MHHLLSGCDRLDDADAAHTIAAHGARLRAMTLAAGRIRDRLRAGPGVVAAATLDLSTLPYPSRFAFEGAAWSPVPYLTMTHRCLLVQFTQRGAIKTLLFNPTDVAGSRATPFFADFIRRIGRLEPLLARRSTPLETQLAGHGLTPADVDYIAFDHLHTQDLRGVLGSPGGARARFPNATLLVPRCEWDDWDDLHPMQRAWYVPDGKRGVDTTRVALTEGDFALGDGVVLARTPGHTSGNQTLFVRTERGIWGTSENGTCADNWSPYASRIPGLARTARRLGLEVVINSNTPEFGAAQYTSMMFERAVVDRVDGASEFVQMLPSSEVTPSALAPGLSPTVIHGGLSHGAVVSGSRLTQAAARVA